MTQVTPPKKKVNYTKQINLNKGRKKGKENEQTKTLPPHHSELCEFNKVAWNKVNELNQKIHGMSIPQE